jgi:hypothetical protein
MTELEPLDLVTLLGSMATLGFKPPETWWLVYQQRLNALRWELKAQWVSGVLGSAARLGLRLEEEYMRELLWQGQRKMRGFHEEGGVKFLQVLSEMLWALVKLEWRPVYEWQVTLLKKVGRKGL